MSELVNEDGLTLEEFLRQYDPDMYKHPSSTVDVVLMTVMDKKLQLLLVRRRNHPSIGLWATPGGFVEMDEDLDAAALRELREETSITDAHYFRQLYTLGKADRDPRTRIITTAYLSLSPEEKLRNLHYGDDAADARWFQISKHTVSLDDTRRVSVLSLYNPAGDIRMDYEVTDTVEKNYIRRDSRLLDTSNTQLAGDHIKIVNMAMDEIQQNVASSGLMFNLLPEEFTLRQAQEVYENITGTRKDTANFRRDILRMLKPTEHKVKVYNRTAQLYRFNPLYKFIKD